MALYSICRRVLTGIRPRLDCAFGSPSFGRNSSHVNLSTRPNSLKNNAKKKDDDQQSLQDAVDNAHLVQILNSEIKSARDSEFLHFDVDVPEDFPFKVQDFPGWRTVVLERKFQGENVTVLVDIPTSAADCGRDDNTDQEPSVPWAIIASKENGLLLHVKGRFLPGRVSVEGLVVNKVGDSEHGVRNAEPNFLKLKENVRNAIHKYLETRGMTSSTADFVLQYMLVKDATEYLRWLRKLMVSVGWT